MKFFVRRYNTYYRMTVVECREYKTHREFLAWMKRAGVAEAVEVPASCVKRLYGTTKWANGSYRAWNE